MQPGRPYSRARLYRRGSNAALTFAKNYRVIIYTKEILHSRDLSLKADNRLSRVRGTRTSQTGKYFTDFPTRSRHQHHRRRHHRVLTRRENDRTDSLSLSLCLFAGTSYLFSLNFRSTIVNDRRTMRNESPVFATRDYFSNYGIRRRKCRVVVSESPKEYRCVSTSTFLKATKRRSFGEVMISSVDSPQLRETWYVCFKTSAVACPHVRYSRLSLANVPGRRAPNESAQGNTVNSDRVIIFPTFPSEI